MTDNDSVEKELYRVHDFPPFITEDEAIVEEARVNGLEVSKFSFTTR